MIVTCPSCATRYLVDPAVLGELGRMVRCARCTHSWMETPPADMPMRVDLTVAPAEPQPIPPGSNLPAIPGKPRTRGWIGWAALVVIAAAVTGAAIVGRDRIVAAWPLAEQLYANLASAEPSPSEVFKVRNTKTWTLIENEQTVYVVAGEIVNVSAHARDVPNVVARIVVDDEPVREKLVFKLARPRLGPGESTEFSKRFSGPPVGAVLVFSVEDNG